MRVGALGSNESSPTLGETNIKLVRATKKVVMLTCQLKGCEHQDKDKDQPFKTHVCTCEPFRNAEENCEC